MPSVSYTLNYSRSEYESKLAFLESKRAKLEGLISKYQRKHDEIRNFWTGSEAENYAKAIEQNINVCKAALQNTKESIEMLNKIVENSDTVFRNINGIVDNAIGIASKLDY